MEPISTLYNLLSATLGVLVVVWGNARYANRGKFDFRTWVTENSNTIVLSFSGIFLAVVSASLIPDLDFSVFGYNIEMPDNNDRKAWFVFGMLVYGGVRKSSKKKR